MAMRRGRRQPLPRARGSALPATRSSSRARIVEMRIAPVDVGHVGRRRRRGCTRRRAVAALPRPAASSVAGRVAVRAVAEVGQRVAQADEIASEREHRVGIVALVLDVARARSRRTAATARRPASVNPAPGVAGPVHRRALGVATACAGRGSRRPDRGCGRRGRRCRACRSRRRSRGTACRAASAASPARRAPSPGRSRPSASGSGGCRGCRRSTPAAAGRDQAPRLRSIDVAQLGARRTSACRNGKLNARFSSSPAP